MTMIARVADGLPLAASIQEDEQVTNTNHLAKLVTILREKDIFKDQHVHNAWFIHSYFRWERILWIINNRQSDYLKH